MTKDLSIETLRGIAIILMVAGHVIGDNPTTGLKVPEDSIYKFIFNVFLFIRMPLFSAISGYIYARHAIKQHREALSFMKRKSVRLLIPFVTATTIFYIFKTITPDVNNNAPALSNIWEIYIKSWFHFWFIQAIFLAFIVVVILDLIKALNNVKRWLFISFAAFALYLITDTSSATIFSINKFSFIFPFFLLGLGINRFRDKLYQFKIFKIATFLVLITFTLQQYLYFNRLSINGVEHKLLLLSVGVPGIISLLNTKLIFKPIATLGFYSFVIYLYHVFGTAGTRILLNSTFGIDNYLILFSIGLLAGLALPVVLQVSLQKIQIVNLLLFGQNRDKSSKQNIANHKLDTQTVPFAN